MKCKSFRTPHEGDMTNFFTRHDASKRAFVKLMCSAAFLLHSGMALTQSEHLLYTPEPPANSAYLRAINTAGEGAVDVFLDGKLRRPKLASGAFSDYFVIPAGRHTVALHPAGALRARASTVLELDAGQAVTLAFMGNTEPLVFEDKANSNMRKASLTLYHLDLGLGPIDVWTADGKAKVFGNIMPGTSAQLMVNPVAVDLAATKSGDKSPQAKTRVTMTHGGNYSLYLLPGRGGRVVAKTIQNTVEHYTGSGSR